MSTPIQPVPDVILASEFPSLADRPAGTYNAKAKAWADSENAMATRTREIALTAKNNAEAAREAADEAVPAAATAVSARDKALEYKESAEAAAAAAGSGAGLPSLVGNAGKALVVGGDEDAVGWQFATPTLGVRNVGAAAAITAADQALMLRCSGTFTLSFAALASMPPGWFCYIKNAGDGDITLDPDGSEQIDGRTSYIMYPGECRLIAHNGTEFVSIVLNSFYKVFESSGNFITPPGYRLFEGLLWGGGQGGLKWHTGSQWWLRGGAGGACMPFSLAYSQMSPTVSFVIGAGGAANTSSNSAIPGGDSQFDSVIAYGGGSPGARVGNAIRNTNPNPDFALVSGFLNAPSSGISAEYGGASGGRYSGSLEVADSPGADSIFGGASGSVGASLAGVSMFGGDGGSSVSPAQAPGGGGYYLGPGARGELRIWGII